MSKATVLIADDDEDILKAIALRLKAHDYEVICAVDALQAVMRARQESPDVAILDVHMPAGDGMSVIEKFGRAEETRYIPVILITADTQAATRDRAVGSGARHYITKPFETKELLKCVEEALASRAAAVQHAAAA